MPKHTTPFNLGTPVEVMERVATYINRRRALDKHDTDTVALYDAQFSVQELTESGMITVMYLDAMFFENCNRSILLNLIRTITIELDQATSLHAYTLFHQVLRNLNDVICDDTRCGSIEEMVFPAFEATVHDLAVVDELIQAHHDVTSQFIADMVKYQAEEETGERVDRVITPSLSDTLGTLQKMFIHGQVHGLAALQDETSEQDDPDDT